MRFRQTSHSRDYAARWGRRLPQYDVLVGLQPIGVVTRIAGRWWIAANAEGDGAVRASTRGQAAQGLLNRAVARRQKKIRDS